MSNFTKRLIFGIIYILLIISATTTNNILFYSLFYIFMMFSIYEFKNLIQLKSNLPYIIGSSFFISSYFSTINNIPLKNIVFITGVLFTFLAFISTLLDAKKNAVKHLGSLSLTILYTIVPFLILLKIPELNSDSDKKIILGIIILIWTSDTFAYLVGRQFGKHKLFERISPKKTIEGFVGGVLFTLIAAYIISIYFTNTSFLQWIIISIIISIFGVIGDLIESMFKRQANIKDSSKLIPGHGGFLDRLDSIIFATPFIYGFLYITKNLTLLLHVS